MLPEKAEVIAAFRQALSEELRAVERVAEMARDETTSEETRQEGKYDTRAIESSYLARGQAARIVSLRRFHDWFQRLREDVENDSVGVGALVAVEGHRDLCVFIAPVGGPHVTVGGRSIQVVSLTSPMGQAMAGLEEGDGFEVDTPGAIREYEIVGIR
ncbi:MAG: GreA/GreB family elongation factor [Myxococcota bacterium]